MNFKQALFLFSVVSVLMLSGCASAPKSTYYWGGYEKLIHDMYVDPGSIDPAIQIAQLTGDIQQAQNNSQPSPPGVHAHLGYMYSLQGNVELSTAEFLEEKKLFPESASFIDGMLMRAKEHL